MELNLNLLSNLIGNSNDEGKFLHKWWLTNKQVSKIRKAFPNGLSANRKFSETQLYKMTQSGRILVELLVAIPQAVLLAEKQALKRLYHLHQN